jgi:small subunit ribosomal protein S1
VADHSQNATSGDRISGVLVKVTAENSFVDFGGRSEGVIKTSELQDADGKMVFDVGDPLEAFVVSDEDEIVLSRVLQRGDRQADLIYQAFKSGMPVEGRVTAVNKWGLGVDVQGVRAFCPVSQISTEFIKSTEEYRDKSMQFKIIRFRDQGRTVVLSRRALLEVAQEKESDSVRALLKKGAKLKGKVTRLEAFGAFVNLGAGVEGLVHVSELRHERVEHPKQVLKSGEEITVEVLGVKNSGHRKNERISLSLKSLEKDPWEEVTRQFKPGSVTAGKVDTLTDYGAFVELAPNVRGMVHVSEMANKRIAHPRDAVSVGDEVRVAVLEVDSKRRRLRLSMKQAERVEDATNMKEFQQRQLKEKQDSPMAGVMADALKRARLID